MSCLRARTAVLAVERPGRIAETCTVVFPAGWTREVLLEYATSVHGPRGESVRVVEWHGARLWLANPDDFTDYPNGLR